MKEGGLGAQGEAELFNKEESGACPQGKESLEGKIFRGTCHPVCPELRRFLGCGTFNAKTGKVPGKPKQVGHPTTCQ